MPKKLVTILLTLIFFSFAGIVLAQEKEDTTPPKRISGGVVNGKAVSLPKPEYPLEARKAGVYGSVNVQIVIDRAGNVISAEAVSGHPLLQEVSVEAAKQSKFQPTLLEGSAVEVSGVIVYNFQNSSVKEEIDNSTESTSNDFQEKSEPMGFALFSKLYDERFIIEDISKIDEPFDEMSNKYFNAPKFTGKFSEKAKDEQTKIIESYKNFYIQNFDSSARWQIQTGEILGDLFKNVIVSMKQTGSPFINETDLRRHLTNINNQMLRVPKNFPEPLSKSLTKLGDYSKHNDLGSAEIQKEIFMNISEFFEIVCPD